jgi:hypothetical protein
MRTMGDSTTAADIPATFDLVAGYIDGPPDIKWSDADWLLHPGKVHVRIATLATTNDGDVLDATPDQAVEWVRTRRAAGADPSVYCGAAQANAVRFAFGQAGVLPPHFWLADWGDGVTPRPAPPIPIGAVALQYAHPPQTGGHYDASIVADFWPGIDPVGGTMTPDEVNALIKAYLADVYGPALEAELTQRIADAQAATLKAAAAKLSA